MPAIILTRLRFQVTDLVQQVNQPVIFCRRLRSLFDTYADRTYRRGETSPTPPLMPNYRVPLQVIRQVEAELDPMIQRDSAAALALADELWTDAYFEPRLLAVYILSRTPLEPAEAVEKRMLSWAQPGEDRRVLNALLTQGTARLRQEHPEEWATQIQDWLASNQAPVQSMGIQAIYGVVATTEFQNLPLVFRLVSPLIQRASSDLWGDLLPLLEILAKRSPAETAFFLRQILAASTRPETSRLVRRCLAFFSGDIQAAIRTALLERRT